MIKMISALAALIGLNVRNLTLALIFRDGWNHNKL